MQQDLQDSRSNGEGLQPFLHVYDMGEGVTAFSTTRHGGRSRGVWGEMNINPYCGDDAEAVMANRTLLAATLGVDASRIVLPHQVHEVEIRRVTPALLSLDETARHNFLEGYDAVMTDERGLCVGVSTADCVPILFYDPVHHAVAAAHAGWRGTVKHMARKTVCEMQAAYGTRPENLKAVIGPCISLRNFEVGQEVYDAFAAAGHDMEAIAVRLDKWHIDLVSANRIQLEAAGVPAAQIMLSGICTYDRMDDYFSARRLGTASGRIYTGIMLGSTGM
jgi:YfiH family protein